MSRKKIQDLAAEITSLAADKTSSLLLEKARALYEETTLLHYLDSNKEISTKESITEKTASSVPIDAPKEPIDIVIEAPKKEETPLSVQERIKQILATAPQINKEPKPTFVQKKTVEIPIPPVEKKIETPKKTELFDEFQDAISADYAADLFEKADKIEITKKSLNDRLSQKQLQIGLNDRIAFVKHLFEGNQTDFNRVFSQLNTFSEEKQAKDFITKVVQLDYNWEGKEEYVTRLITLIERKFL